MKQCLLILLGILACLPTVSIGQTDPVFADKVVVHKAARRLQLLQANKLLGEYAISLGDQPLGHKRRQGDEKTPEGLYTIDYRNPNSRYHLSLHINYPNREDRLNAARRGEDPGGDIFIHGLPNGMQDQAARFAGKDWTDGCIAVDNTAIEAIWRLVKNGTPIEILP